MLRKLVAGNSAILYECKISVAAGISFVMGAISVGFDYLQNFRRSLQMAVYHCRTYQSYCLPPSLSQLHLQHP